MSEKTNTPPAEARKEPVASAAKPRYKYVGPRIKEGGYFLVGIKTRVYPKQITDDQITALLEVHPELERWWVETK